MRSRRLESLDGPLADLLLIEFQMVRERLEAGCELVPVGAHDAETISALVPSYFGMRMDPAPFLTMDRLRFSSYLLAQTRGSGDRQLALQQASATLWGDLDEEFETDHGDTRRLRRIGLRDDPLGRAEFFADVS